MTNDSKFVVYSTIESVLVWDIINLTLSNSFKDSSYPYVYGISMTPNSEYLAIYGHRERDVASGKIPISIQVFMMETGKKIADFNYYETGRGMGLIKISDNGKILAHQSSDNFFEVWKVETGELITKIQHEFGTLRLDVSHDGRFVLSSSYDHTAIVYDVISNKILRNISELIPNSEFTKDNKYLMFSSFNYIFVLNLETNAQVATLEHKKSINDLCLSENGEHLLASNQESVYLWKLNL